MFQLSNPQFWACGLRRRSGKSLLAVGCLRFATPAPRLPKSKKVSPRGHERGNSRGRIVAELGQRVKVCVPVPESEFLDVVWKYRMVSQRQSAFTSAPPY